MFFVFIDNKQLSNWICNEKSKYIGFEPQLELRQNLVQRTLPYQDQQNQIMCSRYYRMNPRLQSKSPEKRWF